MENENNFASAVPNEFSAGNEAAETAENHEAGNLNNTPLQNQNAVGSASPYSAPPAPVSFEETSASDEAKQADALSSAEVSSSGPDFSAASTAHPATSSSDAGNVAFAPGGVSAANETPNTPQSSAVNQPASGAAAPYAQAPGMGQGQQVYSRQFPNSQPAAYQNQNQRIYPGPGAYPTPGGNYQGRQSQPVPGTYPTSPMPGTYPTVPGGAYPTQPMQQTAYMYNQIPEAIVKSKKAKALTSLLLGILSLLMPAIAFFVTSIVAANDIGVSLDNIGSVAFGKSFLIGAAVCVAGLIIAIVAIVLAARSSIARKKPGTAIGGLVTGIIGLCGCIIMAFVFGAIGLAMGNSSVDDITGGISSDIHDRYDGYKDRNGFDFEDFMSEFEKEIEDKTGNRFNSKSDGRNNNRILTPSYSEDSETEDWLPENDGHDDDVQEPWW